MRRIETVARLLTTRKRPTRSGPTVQCVLKTAPLPTPPASMSSRRPKRKRTKPEDEVVEEESKPEEICATGTEVEYTLFGGWLDDGVAGEGGVIEHEGFSLTLGGKNFDISLGDAVLMRGSSNNDDDNDEAEGGAPEYQEDEEDKEMKDAFINGARNKAGAKGMIARVERIWDTTNTSNGRSGECPFMFQARWFLRVRAKMDRDSFVFLSVVPDIFLSFYCLTESGSGIAPWRIRNASMGSGLCEPTNG